MSDNLLTGLLLGLFIGGFIGTLVMAVVATGSARRFPRVPEEAAWAADPRTASPSGQTPAESSMRVDLLHDLEAVPRSPELPVADADEIDQELRELVRRYEFPPQP